MRVFLALFTVICAPFAGAQSRYHVVDLYDDIHVSSVYAKDVNDMGEVLLTNQTSRSFLWKGLGDYKEIRDGQFGTQLTALNNKGQASGVGDVNGYSQSFIYSEGSGIQLLGPINGFLANVANNLNDNGVIAGFATNDGKRHPAMWSPASGWSDLSGQPPFDKANLSDINDAGVISGSFRASDNLIHALIYTPGSGFLDLGLPQGMNGSQADRINKSGVVGGSLSRASDAAEIGFLRDPDGRVTQLLDPVQHFNNSDVLGLSEDRTAVGYINRPAQFGGIGGYVYNEAYGMVDIDTLKDDASSAYKIGACNGISDHGGLIVAEAKLNGVSRQVLLVPVVPEPSTLLFGLPLALLFRRRVRQPEAR